MRHQRTCPSNAWLRKVRFFGVSEIGQAQAPRASSVENFPNHDPWLFVDLRFRQLPPLRNKPVKRETTMPVTRVGPQNSSRVWHTVAQQRRFPGPTTVDVRPGRTGVGHGTKAEWPAVTPAAARRNAAAERQNSTPQPTSASCVAPVAMYSAKNTESV